MFGFYGTDLFLSNHKMIESEGTSKTSRFTPIWLFNGQVCVIQCDPSLCEQISKQRDVNITEVIVILSTWIARHIQQVRH